MSQIYLTNQGTQSEFTGNIQGLTLHENASVALQQLSFEYSDQQMIIDGTNNQLRFSPYVLIGTATTPALNRLNNYIDVTLTPGVYNSREDIVAELEKQFNLESPLYSGAANLTNYRGMQFAAFIDTTDGKVKINYANSLSVPYDEMTYINCAANYDPNTAVVSVNPTEDWITKIGGNATKYSGFFQTFLPTCRSNGEVSLNLNFAGNPTPSAIARLPINSGSWIVGFSKYSTLDVNQEFPLARYEIALSAVAGNNNLTLTVNGASQILANVDLSGNAESLGIYFQYNNTELIVGVQKGAAAAVENTVDTVDGLFADADLRFTVSMKENLTTFLALKTAVATPSHNIFQFNKNPFFISDNDKALPHLPVGYEKPAILNLDENLEYHTFNRYIVFANNLNEVLGFHKNNEIYQGVSDNGAFQVENDKMPDFTDINGKIRTELILQTNLPVKSYQNIEVGKDSFNVFNRRILAIIPSQPTFKVNFYTENPIYLMIDNTKPMDLRQIKLKLTETTTLFLMFWKIP